MADCNLSFENAHSGGQSRVFMTLLLKRFIAFKCTELNKQSIETKVHLFVCIYICHNLKNEFSVCFRSLGCIALSTAKRCSTIGVVLKTL